MKIRNRVKDFRTVKASELKPNPKNWRTHPKIQKDALKGILAEVGIADACIARELDDGSLMLIDGHLRAETVSDTEVPVLILDVDEKEADKLLATLDPLAAMAETDEEKLSELLEASELQNENLRDLVEETAGTVFEDETQDKTYTDKTIVPDYEVTGPKPELSECFNNSKTIELLAKIDNCDLPDDEKYFLRAAAYRHTQFHFQRIAEYFAHSDADIQGLMQDSALVIVDLDKAIANGWTHLQAELNDVFNKDTEGNDEA